MEDFHSESRPEDASGNGWDLACEGLLRSEFGRRPSDALERAMTVLAAEEAHSRRHAQRAAKQFSWWSGIRETWRRRLAIALGVAVAMAAAIAGWQFWAHRNSERPDVKDFATLTATRNARWAPNSTHLRAGDSLSRGLLALESGVVEMEFNNGVRIAVEGPARLTLQGPGLVELREGRLAAEVPRQARGFSVVTPTARVVDQGTRFGVIAREETSKVEVFDGWVELARPSGSDQLWRLTHHMAMILDHRGGRTTAPSSEAAYPQPGRTISLRPVNCGFDKKDFAVLGDVPDRFGVWSGTAYVLTGPVQGIQPHNGPGMLRFLGRRPSSNPAVSRDSSVWQVIDLRHVKDLLANGDVEFVAFANFNRISGPSRADTFHLTAAAFRGSPASAAALWNDRNHSAVSISHRDLVSDDDSGTWERLEVSGTLPPEADYLVLELRAACPDGMSPAAAFPGHFADLSDIYLTVPMRGTAVFHFP